MHDFGMKYKNRTAIAPIPVLDTVRTGNCQKSARAADPISAKKPLRNH